MSRFDRQLPIFGESGQNKIRETHVAIVGCGGLGTNVAVQLALAGVGTMTLIDFDTPSESNLNRQFAYSGETGSKVSILSGFISKVSAETKIVQRDTKMDDDNVDGLLEGCDLVADCLDTVSSRMILNRAVLRKGIPMVHGGVDSLFGQVMTVIPGRTPCLECLMTKDRDGIVPSVGPMVSLIASMQSLEVLKIATGIGETLAGKLLTVDASSNEYETIEIRRRGGCSACSHLHRE